MPLDLKPCPFCDGKAEMIKAGSRHHPGFIFRCENCYSRGPERTFVEEAAEAWNTRPTPDTGIGQGEAVKLAIEALEQIKRFYVFGDDGRMLVGARVVDIAKETLLAIEALKASSAPAPKQEACKECGGSGKMNFGAPCESCGGSGKETK